MTATVRWADVEVGTELPAQSFPIDRRRLVMYAGASGDFNVIHWNERVARSVGLPDVIAHGMLTMAEAVRVVTDWAGDPGAVVQYGVRFTRPVVVPGRERCASSRCPAGVTEKLDDGTVRVELTVRSAEEKVLGQARALVRLA